jgi:hypothetical protein
MTLTRFPHGVLATPSLGGIGAGSIAKFPGLWTNGVLFVDGDGGSDDMGDGSSPDSALKTITAALVKAGRDDTIYIRPKKTTTGWDTLYGATAPTSTYLENLSTTVETHNGISIIGTGNGLGVGGKAVQLSGVSGIAGETIDVRSAFVNIENIMFGRMAAQVTLDSSIIRLYNYSTVGEAYGCTVANCGFEYNVNPEGCIRVDGAFGCAILGNTFRNVEVPIYVSSLDHVVDVLYIESNRFNVSALTLISADIVIGDAYNVQINSNYFGHGIPGHVGGYLKYIYCAGTVSGTVQGNYFGVTGVALGTNCTLSNLTGGGNFSLQGPYTS